MKKRPFSVAIISWFLIVAGIFTFATSFVTMNDPMTIDLMQRNQIPVPVQLAMLYIGILVSLTAGAFMLKGANWARFLYIGWGALGLAVSLLTSPMNMALIQSVLIFALIVFFLLRRNATEYFTGSGPA